MTFFQVKVGSSVFTIHIILEKLANCTEHYPWMICVCHKSKERSYLIILSQSLIRVQQRMTANMSLVRNDGWLDEVNIENPASGVTIFAGVTAAIIFAVNVPILWAIKKEKNYTFINILVGLDCIDSLAHIPILAVFLRYDQHFLLGMYKTNGLYVLSAILVPCCVWCSKKSSINLFLAQ